MMTMPYEKIKLGIREKIFEQIRRSRPLSSEMFHLGFLESNISVSLFAHQISNDYSHI